MSKKKVLAERDDDNLKCQFSTHIYPDLFHVPEITLPINYLFDCARGYVSNTIFTLSANFSADILFAFVGLLTGNYAFGNLRRVRFHED